MLFCPKWLATDSQNPGLEAQWVPKSCTESSEALCLKTSTIRELTTSPHSCTEDLLSAQSAPSTVLSAEQAALNRTVDVLPNIVTLNVCSNCYQMTDQRLWSQTNLVLLSATHDLSYVTLGSHLPSEPQFPHL